MEREQNKIIYEERKKKWKSITKAYQRDMVHAIHKLHVTSSCKHIIGLCTTMSLSLKV